MQQLFGVLGINMHAEQWEVVLQLAGIQETKCMGICAEEAPNDPVTCGPEIQPIQCKAGLGYGNEWARDEKPNPRSFCIHAVWKDYV